MSRVLIGNEYVDIEINAEEAEQAEREYWASIDYDEAVNAKIRERYTLSQELAIHRQEDEKPEEYANYYAYCEYCKNFVKEKISQATERR